MLSVAAPIGAPPSPLGVVTLEQAGDRLLLLRDRALTRLLNLTALATVVGVIAMLAFATVLSLRIGRLKRDLLPHAKQPVELELMRKIKAVFDPNGILNPGKLL